MTKEKSKDVTTDEKCQFYSLAHRLTQVRLHPEETFTTWPEKLPKGVIIHNSETNRESELLYEDGVKLLSLYIRITKMRMLAERRAAESAELIKSKGLREAIAFAQSLGEQQAGNAKAKDNIP